MRDRTHDGKRPPQPFAAFADTEAGDWLFVMSCGDRPRMFGTPGDLEAQCLSNAHVVLSSRLTTWTFDDTVALWRGVARERLGADRFRGEVELHARFHWWRWDDREDEAWERVVSAHRRLWDGMEHAARDPAHAADREHACLLRWTEQVLGHPRRFANPRECEFVLEDLMRRANDVARIGDDARRRYEQAYEGEFQRAGRSSVRWCHDVGTDEEWEARRLRPYPQFSSYDQITDGVTAVVRRMRSLVTT